MKLNIRTLIYPLLMFMFVITTSSSFRNNDSRNDQSVTKVALENGTVKDRNGNVYKTVTIGI